ncbi:MAG: Hsp20/alpha crystallin family protein [Burkholderiales bacterium]|nr:Hsp20/alpha crystallin family protein [Phycisphaerae bacterium]
MVLPIRVHRTFNDPMDVLPREFGTLMDRFLSRRDMADGGSLAPYGVDVRADDDHLYVDAELPGFKKEEIDITLENSTLSITADRKEEPDSQPGAEWLLRERRYTRFTRSFTLPPTVDGSSVDAKLVDGVLKITLNKREETKPRKISVS